jgi:uncharacterized protein YkwD
MESYIFADIMTKSRKSRKSWSAGKTGIYSFTTASVKMFHVEHIILLLVILCHFSLPLRAQDTTITLSGEEAQVLNYINQIRANPKKFYDDYVRSYALSDSRIDPSFLRSLQADIRDVDHLPTLTLSPALEETSRFMSQDLSRSGRRRLSHTSSGGLSFEKRMESIHSSCAGENLYSGVNRSALQMVLDLLIDWRVPDLGHRKNLLNPNYTHIGISLSAYGGDGQVLVTDFSCP